MSIDHDVTEVIAWQLAHKLNLRVDLFLLSPDFRRHYKQVDRLSNAARSAPHNIEKGFVEDRCSFAHRLRLAKGSQLEVMDHLIDAHEQRLITNDELLIAQRLMRRSIRAANLLIRSLEATTAREAESARRRSPPPIRSIPTGSD